VEFEYDSRTQITGIKDQQQNVFPVQVESSSEDILFENNFSPIMLKAGLKLLPGRQISDVYLNELVLNEDEENEICKITLICGKTAIGDFDVDSLKKQAIELIESKKFKKFQVKATLGTKQKYTGLVNLSPWSFNRFELEVASIEMSDSEFKVSKNSISNKYFDVNFNNDGTFDYYDKIKKIGYESLHKFEDWGDKGDEYTFGRIGPESVKVRNLKREIISEGPIYFDIKQNYILELFEGLSEDRNKRIGKVEIPAETIFRFYKELPRIEFKTKLINKAKDHRLRICFDLPFRSFETLTSTHFGTLKRNSTQYGDETYAEAPSGIQAQKRYIRINDTLKHSAVTLMNKGLPEVELVEGSRLALTLVRSVGYLSRMDYEERQMHAGPFLETPGAQELYKEYTFEYSLLIHSKKDPMYMCDNYAETYSLGTKSFLLRDQQMLQGASYALFFTNNPWIRISSIRSRNDKLLVTLYNLNTVYESSTLQINSMFNFCKEITYDGLTKANHAINENQIEIAFNAYEIKMLEFE
ncbi:MAG: glycoside hydrolase family 38 C-terminal domain-containing protein, partial [Candidatus Heimdallarchaeaceae archaeon]